MARAAYSQMCFHRSVILHWHDVLGSNALPVKLLFFTAHVDQQRAVQLVWATSSESNNRYFSIERSADGENFTTIKNVSAAGNSVQKIQYEAIDQSPLVGLAYYRLKQTDFDGHFSYSKIVAVAVASSFSVYPNPTANGVFFVRLDSNQYEYVLLTVKDSQGLTIIEKKYDNPDNPLCIESAKVLTPGFYRVTIKTVKGTQNVKLIVH